MVHTWRSEDNLQESVLPYCYGKIKNAAGSPVAVGSRNAVGPQMVVAGHVAAGSGPWEQPVPGRDGCLSPSSGWSQAGRHMAGGLVPVSLAV